MLPDNEAIMSQVHHLAQEARETLTEAAPAAARQEPGTGVAAPIYLGKAHEVIPSSYIIHYSTTHCKSCHSVSRAHQFYALSYIRSRATGQRVKHLIPCDVVLYNIPVEKLSTGERIIPYCSACPSIDLSHLPPPPIESQLTTLEEPRLKGQKPKAEAKKSTSKATLDDLA